MIHLDRTASPARDLDLIAIDFRTLFVPAGARRILRENDPDGSRGPLFWLAGCARGNIAGVRTDVGDAVARELLALADAEPPFHAPGMLPRHIGHYETLLACTGVAPRREIELVHALPHGLPTGGGHEIVSSGSAAGQRFEAEIARCGMPSNLVELGMRKPADLWAPWCMLLAKGEVAAMAFAARLSDAGAELGLATVPKFRGRGFAPQVTAGWTRLPALARRALFYSTSEDNTASRRVVARLKLRRVGLGLRLG